MSFVFDVHGMVLGCPLHIDNILQTLTQLLFYIGYHSSLQGRLPIFEFEDDALMSLRYTFTCFPPRMVVPTAHPFNIANANTPITNFFITILIYQMLVVLHLPNTFHYPNPRL